MSTILRALRSCGCRTFAGLRFQRPVVVNIASGPTSIFVARQFPASLRPPAAFCYSKAVSMGRSRKMLTAVKTETSTVQVFTGKPAAALSGVAGNLFTNGLCHSTLGQPRQDAADVPRCYTAGSSDASSAATLDAECSTSEEESDASQALVEEVAATKRQASQPWRCNADM